MALTTTASTTHATGAGLFVPKFWDRLLLDNLYPDLYFWQFGDKKSLPPNFGKTVFFTRWKKLGAAVSFTEVNASAITTTAFSASQVSAQVSSFQKALKMSDFLIMTSLADVMQGAIPEAAKALALKMDNVTRTAISAAGTLIKTGGTGAFRSVCGLSAQAIIRAHSKLRALNAKSFPDGYFALIIHPNQTYDLQSRTATGGWLDVNKYVSGGVENLYRGEIGRLYGARVVETSNIPALAGTGVSAAVCTQASGYYAYMITPGAYGVVELAAGGARPHIITKPLGSGGTNDPANTVATVTAKTYFTAVNLDATNRLYKIASGKTF